MWTASHGANAGTTRATCARQIRIRDQKERERKEREGESERGREKTDFVIGTREPVRPTNPTVDASR